MGTPTPPAPVKLIAGLLGASDELLEHAAAALTEPFGPIDARSAVTAWDVSTYYQAEMGRSIRRQFLSFERLIEPDGLVAIKHTTNDLEGRWRTVSGRQVNIDPGYIAATKLVLASTKDAAHRVHLARGIYAEVTLLFEHGSFHAHAHTYPDYAAADAVAFFNGVRQNYLRQLRTLKEDR
jgi:hypothetical protein